jgi:hypothetical protein
VLIELVIVGVLDLLGSWQTDTQNRVLIILLACRPFKGIDRQSYKKFSNE